MLSFKENYIIFVGREANGLLNVEVACWSFTSWRHLRSHQDGNRHVTTPAHDDFIVPPHWETSAMTWYPTQSHFNAEHLGRKWQVDILKSLLWLNMVSNPPISPNGRLTLTIFGHHVWSPCRSVGLLSPCLSVTLSRCNFRLHAVVGWVIFWDRHVYYTYHELHKLSEW